MSPEAASARSAASFFLADSLYLVMSYSNRPGYRPDPTVAPVVRDLNGKLRRRDPFTPSARRERLNAEREERRKAGR